MIGSAIRGLVPDALKERLKHSRPYLEHRSKPGDWENHFSRDLKAYFNERTGDLVELRSYPEATVR